MSGARARSWGQELELGAEATVEAAARAGIGAGARSSVCGWGKELGLEPVARGWSWR